MTTFPPIITDENEKEIKNKIVKEDVEDITEMKMDNDKEEIINRKRLSSSQSQFESPEKHISSSNRRIGDFFKPKKAALSQSPITSTTNIDIIDNHDSNSSLTRFNLSPSIPPPSPKEQNIDLTFVEGMEESWKRALIQEFTKPYFISLKKFIQEEESKFTIFPPRHLRYSWSTLCPLDSVKIVILGQDPYHNDGQAMGLCFSVPKPVPPPPSLVNMFKELERDVPEFKAPNPIHGDLSNWAKQGVLLLNTCLTVKAHQAASHAGKGWESLTDAIIKMISMKRKNLVFMLWGNFAIKRGEMICSSSSSIRSSSSSSPSSITESGDGGHLILKAAHPSPLSANRGFIGCGHFSKANKYLVSRGLRPINWRL